MELGAMMNGSYHNFESHVNAQTVMKPIADFIATCGRAVTLRDIVEATGFKNTQVARTMPRLISKGVVRIAGRQPRTVTINHAGGWTTNATHHSNLYEWIGD